MSESQSSASVADNAGAVAGSLMPPEAERQRLRKIRGLKDLFAGTLVAVGGIGVIVSLALIFVYLFSEVAPMLRPADINKVSEYRVPGDVDQTTLWLTLDRYNEVASRFTADGRVLFFKPGNGESIRQVDFAIPEAVSPISFAIGEPKSHMFIYGLDNGTAIVGKHDYDLSYPDDVRLVSPKISYPLGEEPLVMDEQGIGLAAVTVQEVGRGAGVAAVTQDGRVLLAVFSATESFMTGEIEITRNNYELPGIVGRPVRLLLSSNMRNLIVADERGYLHYYDIRRPAETRLMDSRQVVPEGVRITTAEYLNGTVSFIVGDDTGGLGQWTLFRDAENQYSLQPMRSFQSHNAAITYIHPEYIRKGFVAADASGAVGLHYTSSERSLKIEPVTGSPVVTLGLAPRNNMLLAIDESRQLNVVSLWNQHPEISFSALWQKVLYEGRTEKEYIWQSSSASNEFEPKLSLVPLTVGTLKAAFFAMLFAMPIAVLGAIYSAYFMTPKMRGMVKPTIEIMEALPTVILGFLAGLWLAPFAEQNLPAIFSIFLLMPIGFLLAALLWQRVPAGLRNAIPPGWEAAILIPVVLGIGWVCVTMSPLLELWFFNGDMRQWLTDVGINYDQRNALVVGIAMGFAVIPTIFSIAEDAVFNVPKHLTRGSLALGATPWQTVWRVVLLTASPGIFSAIMIGFGRAVGETMIVVMATGNSPVVNFNIFEGMRTLSANIAVEMPEAEVGATHFRILFLAALVLFALTFFVNTIAEVVRQRLRKRYSSL